MTKENTIAILGLIKIAYPRFYQNITKADAEATIKLWHGMFSDSDFQIVKLAVESLIASQSYPPTISDVKSEMFKIINFNGDTAIEEWQAIKKAMSNAGYNAVRSFEQLPEIAKKFVGSPNQLKEWALSQDFNDSVVRGQFIKQYEVLKQREKYKATIPLEVQGFISKLAEKKAVPEIAEPELRF